VAGADTLQPLWFARCHTTDDRTDALVVAGPADRGDPPASAHPSVTDQRALRATSVIARARHGISQTARHATSASGHRVTAPSSAAHPVREPEVVMRRAAWTRVGCRFASIRGGWAP
jgi:hypothetical protein